MVGVDFFSIEKIRPFSRVTNQGREIMKILLAKFLQSRISTSNMFLFDASGKFLGFS